MIELPLNLMPLKGKQYKIDADGDKKITKKDFLLIAARKKKKNGNKSA